MKIFEFIDPVPVQLAPLAYHAERLGSLVRQHTLGSGWEALLGSPLDLLLVFLPNVQAEGIVSHEFSRMVRGHLYEYFVTAESSVSLGDAGNIRSDFMDQAGPGEWKHLWSELLTLSKTVICLGGNQKETVSAAQALSESGAPVNLCVVDALYDFHGEISEDSGLSGFLDSLLINLAQKIGFLSFIGIQNFLNPPSISRQLDKFLFDTIRLSELREEPEEAEPLLRLSNMMSLDLTSLEAACVPELKGRRPNGLNGVEICRLARYAGFSDSLRYAGIHNILIEEGASPEVTAQMTAQILWHVLDGRLSRLQEYEPDKHPDYNQYMVQLPGIGDQPLVFYQHRISGRWWMEIPDLFLNSESPFSRQRFIPCSYKDYIQAQQGHWPERWWKAIQRLDK